ncbi:MAG: 23S rRNA (uracil(1939)-C(5))-methyltransferase RlmD [Bacteroidia bacterium]
MSRKKNKTHELLSEVLVSDMAADGLALARVNDKVYFIEGAVPGDWVEAQVYRDKKRYAMARMTRLLRPSPQRIPAACQHFEHCGGCKWQHLDYPSQLHYKGKQVYDALERLGKITLTEQVEVLGSAQQYHFRNKLEFTFSPNRWFTPEELADESMVKPQAGLGFHLPGRFDKVLHVDQCLLMDDRMNLIRQQLHQLAETHGLSRYNVREHHGFLRTLTIRHTSLDQWMVLLMVGENQDENLELVLSSLAESFPWINSLLYVINTKKNDTLYDQEVLVWRGSPVIEEQLEDLRFEISAKSFFQTNSHQALELYKLTREFAGLSGQEVVYDLYTGTGSIAQFVARNAKKVVGIEYVEAAVEDARKNAERNGIGNCSFFAGDMKSLLNNEFVATHGKPDVVITDPPRAGMHADVVAMLCDLGAPRIVYVSCNPATQARDLDLMREHYRLVKYQPVDMFPQTAHVENIALLEKIS